MVLAAIVFFVVMPLVELAIAIWVAGLIGWVPTLLALAVLSIGGAWAAKRQGGAIIGRARDAFRSGGLPAREGLDGTLVVVAGVLCILPGFLTDLLGLALLVPVVRHPVGRWASRRWKRSVPGVFVASVAGRRRRRAIDVEWVGDVTPRPAAPVLELEPGDD